MGFDFSEYDKSGEVVNEKGYIAGGQIEIGKGLGPVWMSAQGSILKGEVDYDGETQSGNPHQTVTAETIYDYSLQIGRIYESWRRHDFATIYFGVGFHQWARDIKTKNGVVGLFERYTWYYAHVGARGFLFRTDRFHFMVELNLLRTIKPVIDVNFKGAVDPSGKKYDNDRLDLGEHYGAKFSLPIRMEITRRFQLYTEFYFEAWDLGGSEETQLTTQGFVAGFLEEPRSTSRFFGVKLGLFLKFD